MPPERIIFLQGLLEPSFWILAKYLHTFLGWAVCKDQFLFCQNLCKSIQKKARADLAPPQICHFSATKLSVQPSRKSNPAVGTNPVQHDCSQRNDKFVAEEKLSALGAFVPPTDFVSWRIWLGWDGMGWDLCAGLFYEHRFAMLIMRLLQNGSSSINLAQISNWPILMGIATAVHWWKIG